MTDSKWFYKQIRNVDLLCFFTNLIKTGFIYFQIKPYLKYYFIIVSLNTNLGLNRKLGRLSFYKRDKYRL